MPNFLKFLVLSVALSFFFYSCGDDTDDPILSNQKEIVSFQINSVKGTIDANTHKISVVLPYDTDITKLSPTITVSEKATVSPNSGKAVDFSNPVTYTVTAEDKSVQDYIVTAIKEEFKPIVTTISKTEGLIEGERFSLQGDFAAEGNIVKLIDEKEATTVLEIVSEDSKKITVKLPDDIIPNKYSISVTSQGITVVPETKISIVEAPIYAPVITSATIDSKKTLTVAGKYFVDVEDLEILATQDDWMYGRVFSLPEGDDTIEITKTSITYQLPETLKFTTSTHSYSVTIRTAKGTTEPFKIFIEE